MIEDPQEAVIAADLENFYKATDKPHPALDMAAAPGAGLLAGVGGLLNTVGIDTPLRNAADTLSPRTKDSLAGRVLMGAGSALPYVGLGSGVAAGARALGAGETVAGLAGAAAPASAIGVDAGKQAYERAIHNGASDGAALWSGIAAGSGNAALMMLPMHTFMGQFMGKLNTGNVLGEALIGGGSNAVATVLGKYTSDQVAHHIGNDAEAADLMEAAKELGPESALAGALISGVAAYYGKPKTAEQKTPENVLNPIAEMPDPLINAPSEEPGYQSPVIKEADVPATSAPVLEPQKVDPQTSAPDPQSTARFDAGSKFLTQAAEPATAPKTGVPFKFNYVRNMEKSPKMGATYGQDVEPRGRYLSQSDNPPPDLGPKWEKGAAEFSNPLVLDFGGGYKEPSNWKRVLSAQFGGKTGKALSQAVANAGHDGIVTVDKYGTSEIVDLSSFVKKPNVSKPSAPETPDNSATPTDNPPVSIKNASTDAEMARMGLDPTEHPLDPKTFADEWQRAKDEFTPEVGQNLVRDLESKPRPPTAHENALLAFEVNRRINERDAAEEAYIADPSAANKKRIDEATQSYAQIEAVTKQAGTQSSGSLNFRRMMLNRDYSLAALERKLQVAQDGEPLTEEQRAQVSDIARRIAELEKNVSAEEVRSKTEQADAAVQALKTEVRARKPRNAAESWIKQKADEARARLKAKRGVASAGFDPQDLLDVATIGAEHLVTAGLDVAEWTKAMVHEFGDEVKPHLDAIYKEAKAQFDKANVERLVAKVSERRASDENADPSIRALAKHFIEQGVEPKSEPITAAIQGVLPDLTPREIHDAISGYGRFRELSKEESDVKLRELSGVMREISKLEDVQKRIAPKKSGYERAKPTDEERQLRQRVAELAKQYGLKGGTHDALGALKSRLKNQITDLQTQIDKGERIVPERKPVERDVEAAALQARVDELRATYKELFGSEKTDEQRAAAALKHAEESLAEYERKLRENDLWPKTKQGPPTKTVQEILDQKKAVEARRNALRKEVEQLRNPPKSPEERRQDAAHTRIANELARMLEAKARGDYSKKPKPVPVPLRPETVKAKAELEKVKREFERERLRAEYANRSKAKKIADAAQEVLDLPKAVMTSFDLSAPGRQGFFFAIGHPIETAENLRAMIRAVPSEEAALKIDVAIRNRPGAAFGDASKLELTRHGDDIGPHEEAIRSRWSDKIPGVKMSNRAFITFLNSQRAARFDELVRALPGKPTLEQGKILADFVNKGTGRGSFGKFSAALPLASKILWSPRLVVSRFQLLSGQPMWKGDMYTRKVIAKDYARTLIGMSALYTIAKIAGARIGDEDRSSAFGKIIVGNTRIDPLAGLSQATVFTERMRRGEKVNMKGVVQHLRGEEHKFTDPTSTKVVWDFLRSKFTPMLGIASDVADGKNMIGEPVTVKSVASNLLVPLSIRDVYDAMREQGVAKGAALGILSVFGMGLQTYSDQRQ